MRYLTSFLLVLVLSNHNCSAQDQKINLSSLLHSTFLSHDCSYLLTDDEKLYIFTDKNKKVQEFINFDCYNSHGAQIVYNTDEKYILKKLKKVDSANVLSIEIISQDKGLLILKIDLSKTNYELYLNNKFQITLIDSWLDVNYEKINGEWSLTKMTCNGF